MAAQKSEIDYIIANEKAIFEAVTVLNQFDTNSHHRLLRAVVKIYSRRERNKLIRK